MTPKASPSENEIVVTAKVPRNTISTLGRFQNDASEPLHTMAVRTSTNAVPRPSISAPSMVVPVDGTS